jgi:hypothetical protein
MLMNTTILDISSSMAFITNHTRSAIVSDVGSTLQKGYTNNHRLAAQSVTHVALCIATNVAASSSELD